MIFINLAQILTFVRDWDNKKDHFMTRKRELYSSAIRSRKMIRQALLDLMKEKSFDTISISEIMARADLVRRTFYAHHKSKEDILTMYIDELVNESFDYIFTDVKKCNGSMSLVYFRLWNNHKSFINLLKNNNLLPLLNNFHKQIDEIHDKADVFDKLQISKTTSKYASYFYAGSMWSVLTKWIESGMNETPEELAEILDELIIVSNSIVSERKKEQA